jgi:hypothetical protein
MPGPGADDLAKADRLQVAGVVQPTWAAEPGRRNLGSGTWAVVQLWRVSVFRKGRGKCG